MKQKWLAVLAASFLTHAMPSWAEEGMFYADKTIKVIIPASAGGSYGLYGQLIVDHLGRHIPGDPDVVLEYMDGAGGIRASNAVASVAARDGTVLYMMHQNAPTAQLVSPDATSYDVSEFAPIGILSAMNSVMVVRTDLGVDGVEDLAKTAVTIGATGRGSYQFIVPTLMNHFGRAEFKIVPTYSGAGEVQLALERGEVGASMNSLSAVQEQHDDWIDGTGIAHVILQVGTKPAPDLLEVPLLTDLAQSPSEAALYQFLSISNAMARALVMPPETPADKVATLRAAFGEMIADPAFRSAADALQLPLDSADHAEFSKLISTLLATPPETLDLAQSVLGEE
jgi:tripartite-type tricarboxylate transporter receptor subunit TctC